MSQDTQCVLHDSKFDSSSMKHFNPGATCLLDLPNEILLLICRYMTPVGVLYSFYTPEQPQLRLHRVIFDYCRKIKVDGITNNEYIYLSNLFSDCKTPVRPESLMLSNENVFCLIERYFSYMPTNLIESIFVNLKYLTLIDCCPIYLDTIERYYIFLTQIEYLHITIRQISKHFQLTSRGKSDTPINKILFGRQSCSLREVIIHDPDGLILHETLIPHENLRHIDLTLQTIDDLYLLLGGLVPNIEKIIIQLCQSPKFWNTLLCPRLTDFTLLEYHTRLVIHDIKCILGYMSNLTKLTLSIHDASDPIFCRGPIFESILTELVPHLDKFDYTMTRRMNDKTLIEDFIRWPMNVTFYENQNCKWIHIYSLPWPSSKDDKRRLPIVYGGSNLSVTAEVKRADYMKHVIITKYNELVELKTYFCRAIQITTYLLINIKLPSRIVKVILTKQARIGSINSMVQPFVRHLIVEHRLGNKIEMSILARQYPNVQYLKLSFPLEQSSYIRCFQRLFNVDDNRRYWPELINFSTQFFYDVSKTIMDDNDVYHWLVRKADLKLVKSRLYADCFNSMLFIWV